MSYGLSVDQLVDLIKSRDEKGLSYLYDNYAATLNGIISRIVGSEKIAEEVLQSCFLKIWDKIDQYDKSKSSLFTWMARIARNSAIDVTRLKKHKNNKVTDTIERKHESSFVTNQNIDALDTVTLLNKIDDKYRIVIDYVYLRGYSHSAAAEELDIPLGTVKTRIRKGIGILRKELKNEKSLFLGSVLIIYYIIFSCCL